jgi:hypothetical protein
MKSPGDIQDISVAFNDYLKNYPLTVSNSLGLLNFSKQRFTVIVLS